MTDVQMATRPAAQASALIGSDELIARTRALLPGIAARAERTERNRAILEETLDELIDAGILATIAPRAYGGHECGLDTFATILRLLSAACPSTGWVSAFFMGAAWRLLVFSGEAQAEIYGDNNYVLGAGTASPIKQVRRVPGGYVISGRTPWASGSSHAQWFTFNGLLFEDGGPTPMTFAVPRRDVTIIDTWHVMGMRGTASNDIAVDELFVPEYRAAPFVGALTGTTGGQALHANPMYHIPFVPFAVTEVLPVVVGAHRGAVDVFAERTRERQGTISQARAIEKVTAQLRLGRSLARAEAAELLLSAYVARNAAGRAQASEPIDRSEMKLKSALITELCLDNVNDMARGVGGDAFRDDAVFQRYFRDINMVARHAFLDIDTAAESYGKLVLGLPVNDPLI